MPAPQASYVGSNGSVSESAVNRDLEQLHKSCSDVAEWQNQIPRPHSRKKRGTGLGMTVCPFGGEQDDAWNCAT
jgi:hypothetical protein